MDASTLQAALAAAPDALFGRLWDAFFAGSLAALTSGPISNFVVQAALASARTGSQVGAVTSNGQNCTVAQLLRWCRAEISDTAPPWGWSFAGKVITV